MDIEIQESDNATTQDAASQISEPAATRIVEKESFRSKLVFVLIAGSCTFIGTLAGIWLSSNVESQRWQRETIYMAKKEILTKRIELLERTVKDINQLQTIELYMNSNEYLLLEAKDSILSEKTAQSSVEAVEGRYLKVKELQTEFSIIMTLDSIYFGPKTRKAVSSLNKALENTTPWWKVGDKHTSSLMNALAKELRAGL